MCSRQSSAQQAALDLMVDSVAVLADRPDIRQTSYAAWLPSEGSSNISLKAMLAQPASHTYVWPSDCQDWPTTQTNDASNPIKWWMCQNRYMQTQYIVCFKSCAKMYCTSEPILPVHAEINNKLVSKAECVA